MNSTTPAIRELARRLIALEAPREAPRVADGGEVARVCEKLRMPLTKFAGVAGYRSLISRAVAIAKAKDPSLNPVQVGSDGSLEGIDLVGQRDAEAGVAVLVHLLGLLVTFIGEPSALGLVRDAWPDAPLEKIDSQAKEQ
jgi:hypothetical protein